MWVQGTFSTDGEFPPVTPGDQLVKGLFNEFNESLPPLLEQQDAANPSGRLPNLTYLHVDCDLYAGARLISGLSQCTEWLTTSATLCIRELDMCQQWRLAGANDVLTLLNDRLSPGAMAVFDEVCVSLDPDPDPNQPAPSYCSCA